MLPSMRLPVYMFTKNSNHAGSKVENCVGDRLPTKMVCTSYEVKL